MAHPSKVDEELSTASRIQQAMLPEPRRTGPFFEAVGASIPSRGLQAKRCLDEIHCRRRYADGATRTTKKRASLYVVRGRDGLRAHDPGGLEPLSSSLADFRARLLAENHTVKRSLTDPRLFAGIGNAYSDELLHRARMSPVKLTSRLTDEEVAALHDATVAVLSEWTERLRAGAAASPGGFPEKVTAFRPEMAVHGKHRQPCPVCGTLVQRIVRAENEVNYCPRCQTGGQILSDRSLARLLKEDWPRTIDELEKNPALAAPRAPPPRRGGGGK
jgi:formamidopyrimidine-DNA glycosylase